jgi:outer membrane receptor protein involved in Fe transport
LPTQSTVGIGRQDERGQNFWLHPYIQDDWQVTPNLTLNLGLRWEYNQQMRDRDNRLSLVDFAGGAPVRYVIASDDNGTINPTANLAAIPAGVPYVTSASQGWDRSLLDNSTKRFSPRIGLSWRLPTKQDIVVRGGFGIHNNQWAYSVQQSLAANLPFFVTKTANAAAGVVTPAASATTRNVLASAGAAPGGNTMIHEYKPEYNQAWSLSVQHQLTSDFLWEIAYYGSRINHADNSTVLNVPLPGPGAIAARRPAPQLSQVTAIRWDGWSNYNALRVRVEKRASKGLYLLANYTWSKMIDVASDPGGTEAEANLPQDVYNYQNTERALSSFDHRHRVTATISYLLPVAVGEGVVRKLTEGWQLSTIFSAQSGAPFTISNPNDTANIGAGPAQRPNVIRDPNLDSGRTPDRWFDTTAFVLPAAFTFGNSGRNTVFAPGEVQLDAALQKEFHLVGEGTKLQFRTEMFNVLNHANFGIPNRIFNTAANSPFGKITNARDARQMQFGLRVVF